MARWPLSWGWQEVPRVYLSRPREAPCHDLHRRLSLGSIFLAHLFHMHVALVASISVAALLVSSSSRSVASGKVVSHLSSLLFEIAVNISCQLYWRRILDNVWLSIFHHRETELILLPRFKIRNGWASIWCKDSCFLAYPQNNYGKA